MNLWITLLKSIDSFTYDCYCYLSFPFCGIFIYGVLQSTYCSNMTNTKHKISRIYNLLVKVSYKLFIVTYSLYMVFLSQAFALQAEAPLGAQNFKEVETSDFFFEDFVIEESIDDRPEKIRDYFNRHNLPLAEHAELFVESADRYDIDWKLLAAIGFIESTGGKFACKGGGHNAFGWGSCSIYFDSYAESIDHISMNLAGEYPSTAKYYAGKDIRGILWSYNPDTIRAGYGDMVIREMGIIDSM